MGPLDNRSACTTLLVKHALVNGTPSMINCDRKSRRAQTACPTRNKKGYGRLQIATHSWKPNSAPFLPRRRIKPSNGQMWANFDPSKYVIPPCFGHEVRRRTATGCPRGRHAHIRRARSARREAHQHHACPVSTPSCRGPDRVSPGEAIRRRPRKGPLPISARSARASVPRSRRSVAAPTAGLATLRRRCCS
jgi:hypothetical protein